MNKKLQELVLNKNYYNVKWESYSCIAHIHTHTKNSNIQNFHPLKSIAEKIYIKKYLIGTK